MPKRATRELRLLHRLVITQLTMSVEPTNSNPPSAEARRPSKMKGDFIGVGEVHLLVPYLKGNEQALLAFIGNVDTTFALINPHQDVLYKFVLMRIIGKTRTAISYRILYNWEELKDFL